MTNENDIKIFPSHDQLRSMFKGACISLKKTVNRKLKDASILRSSSMNPHHRQIFITNVQKLVFAGVYGNLITAAENKKVLDLQNSTPLFEILSIERAAAIFGSQSLLRCHDGNNTTIITPWYIINQITNALTIEDKKKVSLNKGQLIIPLFVKTDFVRVFVPCGGPDPETDSVPDYVRDIYLDQIMDVDVTSIKFVRALEKLSLLRNTDWSVIRKGQVEKKDIICSRGIFYKVKSLEDDFDSPLTHNMVKFTINATRNVNNQPFSIAKIPKLQGCICEIPLKFVSKYRPVSIVLEKIDSEDIGTVTIKFQNGCFNSLGFMIHDTAIFLDTQ